MRPRPPDLPPLDTRLGLHPLFFTLPADDANYVKIIFESYESFGVVRAQDPAHTPDRVLMVLLLAPDFAEDALRVAAELAAELDMVFPPPSEEMLVQLREDLLEEL
jgi:hypothetical protein